EEEDEEQAEQLEEMSPPVVMMGLDGITVHDDDYLLVENYKTTMLQFSLPPWSTSHSLMVLLGFGLQQMVSEST
ncbi:hypothetical protein Tco_0576229, partial [Tanacetum coccineum]